LSMSGITSYSLIYPLATELSPPHALFCDSDDNNCHLEFYPRAVPNELYVCGIGGGATLNEGQLRKTRGAIVVESSRIDAGVRSVAVVVSTVRDAQAQACLRPCSDDALPTMCRIPNVNNAFVAAGHNCWGILWSLVSGLAMAELIVDGHSDCVDLSPFDIARFQ